MGDPRGRWPGISDRILERLRALGYWKDGKPELVRFSLDHRYLQSALYKWTSGGVPTYENVMRLARDLDVAPAWLMFGEAHGITPPADSAVRPLPVVAKPARKARRGQLARAIAVASLLGSSVQAAIPSNTAAAGAPEGRGIMSTRKPAPGGAVPLRFGYHQAGVAESCPRY